jgi:penicillin amidase
MTLRGLSESRINELLPIYPPNAPTVLQPQDLNVMNPLQTIQKRTASVTEENVSPKQDKASHLPLEQIYREFTSKQSSKRQEKKDNTNQLRGNLLTKIKPYLQFWPSASNNWVISGNRTTNGKPFLCNDPHLGLSV